MIKKIGSNKYGVVEYAISSVEDIADLPLGVAIGSTAVLINKDGIRTFALGEGEWVEYIDAERYDKNKLAQDLLFCGFGNDGEKHDDLDDRLIAEFDEINERVNVGNYLEYNGCRVKADYSLEGLQRGVVLEGRTLQNLAPKTLTNTTKDSQGYFTSTAVEWDYLHRVSDNEPLLLKPNTEYTYIIEVVENTFNTYLYFPSNEQSYFVENVSLVFAKPLQTGVFVIKRKTKSVFDDSLLYDHYIACEKTAIESGTFKLRIICLEGDYTETPLEELPFIEEIQSSGEEGVISGKTCGKNLIKNIMPKTQRINGVDITVNDDGSVTFNGTATKQTTIHVDTNPASGSDVKKIKSGTYSLSDVNGNYNILFTQLIIRSSNGTQTSYNILNEGVSKNNIRVNADSWEQVLFIIRANQPLNNVTLYPQLEESSVATPYEPYQEFAYSIDYPLRSLPNGVCDTYDFESGILTQRVGRYTFTGNEPFSLADEVKGDVTCVFTGVVSTNIDRAETFNNIICDNLACYSYGFYEDVQGILASPSCFIFSFKNGTLKSNDIAGANQWLKDNPTTILYELAEPIVHQLDQNRIYSFKDTTHVVSDNLIAPRITTNILTNSNALISHLKGENLALTNEVSTLSLRNRETQETNETQDHIIDASLCAVDELYTMYETTQEVEAMSADEEGSRMVDMYVAMVQRGLKTIDQVPVRYRERVREILAQLED